MDEATFREHLLAQLRQLAEAIIDQGRAVEALALVVTKQGRQGTLRVKIEAPSSKLRGKRRRLKKALAAGKEVR
jgi:hypothetical protein